MPVAWLDPPPAGTKVAGGFDGATVSDWTVIKLETVTGLLFTPRYGPNRAPTLWNPAEWPGESMRGEVEAAWAEITATYRVGRVYCDPWHYQTDIDRWAGLYGADVFVDWHTNRDRQMHAALERTVTDLSTGVLKHDGCPITTLHMANARKIAKPGDRYIIGKPSEGQKIDGAMGSVLAHEAASDLRAEGWTDEDTDTTVICFR